MKNIKNRSFQRFPVIMFDTDDRPGFQRNCPSVMENINTVLTWLKTALESLNAPKEGTNVKTKSTKSIQKNRSSSEVANKCIRNKITKKHSRCRTFSLKNLKLMFRLGNEYCLEKVVDSRQRPPKKKSFKINVRDEKCDDESAEDIKVLYTCESGLSSGSACGNTPDTSNNEYAHSSNLAVQFYDRIDIAVDDSEHRNTKFRKPKLNRNLHRNCDYHRMYCGSNSSCPNHLKRSSLVSRSCECRPRTKMVGERACSAMTRCFPRQRIFNPQMCYESKQKLKDKCMCTSRSIMAPSQRNPCPQTDHVNVRYLNNLFPNTTHPSCSCISRPSCSVSKHKNADPQTVHVNVRNLNNLSPNTTQSSYSCITRPSCSVPKLKIVDLQTDHVNDRNLDNVSPNTTHPSCSCITRHSCSVPKLKKSDLQTDSVNVRYLNNVSPITTRPSCSVPKHKNVDLHTDYVNVRKINNLSPNTTHPPCSCISRPSCSVPKLKKTDLQTDYVNVQCLNNLSPNTTQSSCSCITRPSCSVPKLKKHDLQTDYVNIRYLNNLSPNTTQSSCSCITRPVSFVSKHKNGDLQINHVNVRNLNKLSPNTTHPSCSCITRPSCSVPKHKDADLQTDHVHIRNCNDLRPNTTHPSCSVPKLMNAGLQTDHVRKVCHMCTCTSKSPIVCIRTDSSPQTDSKNSRNLNDICTCISRGHRQVKRVNVKINKRPINKLKCYNIFRTKANAAATILCFSWFILVSIYRLICRTMKSQRDCGKKLRTYFKKLRRRNLNLQNYQVVLSFIRSACQVCHKRFRCSCIHDPPLASHSPHSRNVEPITPTRPSPPQRSCISPTVRRKSHTTELKFKDTVSKTRINQPIPDRKRKYMLYFTNMRGWLVKPMRSRYMNCLGSKHELHIQNRVSKPVSTDPTIGDNYKKRDTSVHDWNCPCISKRNSQTVNQEGKPVFTNHPTMAKIRDDCRKQGRTCHCCSVSKRDVIIGTECELERSNVYGSKDKYSKRCKGFYDSNYYQGNKKRIPKENRWHPYKDGRKKVEFNITSVGSPRTQTNGKKKKFGGQSNRDLNDTLSSVRKYCDDCDGDKSVLLEWCRCCKKCCSCLLIGLTGLVWCPLLLLVILLKDILSLIF